MAAATQASVPPRQKPTTPTLPPLGRLDRGGDVEQHRLAIDLLRQREAEMAKVAQRSRSLEKHDRQRSTKQLRAGGESCNPGRHVNVPGQDRTKEKGRKVAAVIRICFDHA